MDNIGIGFVGAGWMGRALLEKLLEREDVRLLGLHQRNRERAESVLTELGCSVDLYEADYATLLANPDIHAIFIASSNEAHGPQSIAAMEAGKHVFCEKPCATRYTDYLLQIERARQFPELITFVDYLMNFDTMENQLRQMVKDGAFGRLTQVQVNYRHPVNITGEKVWKLRREQIGDAIGQGIIHSLSVLVNILEAQGDHPVWVFASSSEIHNRGFEVPAVWNIQVGFASGAAGFCFGNIDHANGYDAYHNLHGTKGGFIFDSYLPRPAKVRYWSEKETKGAWVVPLDPTADQAPAHLWPPDTTTPDSGDVMNHQTARCVDHFLQCIHKGQQSHLSFERSAVVAEVGWAALMSAKTQRPVNVPIEASEAKAFFADPE